LAIVIAVASVLAVAGLGFAMPAGRPWPWTWYGTVLFVIASVWGLPLFWIVALTGRPPRRWLGIRAGQL